MIEKPDSKAFSASTDSSNLEQPFGGRHSWRESLLVYTKPQIISMVFLGFSAGLPYLLVFSTLSAWLRDEDVSRAVIGFFSWVGLTFSIKVFWAPVVDRVMLPFLDSLLGKRRSWMIVAQIGIALGLIGMSVSDVHTQLEQIALFAVVVAFCSATQDITIDAYRVEAIDQEYQGAMAAAYVMGYRIALLVAGAGMLYLASYIDWQFAYEVMAALMSIGVLTALLIREPEHTISPQVEAVERRMEELLHIPNQKQSLFIRFSVFISDAVISPFAEFFSRNGRMAIVILALIGVYKLSDITMGVMAYPFYLDLGYSKIQIANVAKLFGFFMTIAGAIFGGILVMRFGIMKPLLLGAILVATTNLLFAILAVLEPTVTLLAVVISADNFGGGIATSVFIAYLSSLTNTAYTATQYALFSSLMTLPAKLLGGFSGIIVDYHGYFSFFVYAAAIGLPAIFLVIYLIGCQRKQKIREAVTNHSD
ncbi:MAG: AmpG family muropeptide MFS transporter [Methylococcales bacterium]